VCGWRKNKQTNKQTISRSLPLAVSSQQPAVSSQRQTLAFHRRSTTRAASMAAHHHLATWSQLEALAGRSLLLVGRPQAPATIERPISHAPPPQVVAYRRRPSNA